MLLTVSAGSAFGLFCRTGVAEVKCDLLDGEGLERQKSQSAELTGLNSGHISPKQLNTAVGMYQSLSCASNALLI